MASERDGRGAGEKSGLRGLGLTTDEARSLQLKHGKNELSHQKKESFAKKVLHIICEPMFLLLIAAAGIYFILGEPHDALVMLVFVIGIISIDVIQEWKTDKTLSALKDLSAPHINVLRDGEETQIASADIVPGDVMMVHEGVKIPADGFVVRCSDLCVDESTLTGEAEGVWKIPAESIGRPSGYWRRDYCYAGTLVTQGSGAICVDKIGSATEYGRIGVNVAEAPEESTPLQVQAGSLVKLCAGIAAVLFALVAVVTWLNIPDHLFKDRLTESILAGIALAMAMIPEEFPVILTVFLSMGAWRLAKKQSLVRRLPSVETLGAVSVLCVDKTGTITMNQMTVQETWAIDGDERRLCETMGLGCEMDAYDPMEKAMLAYCEKLGISQEYLFGAGGSELVKEYAFTNELKMMGHVWRRDGGLVLAAKGSPERVLVICDLSRKEREVVLQRITALAKEGLRVIAVATSNLTGGSAAPGAGGSAVRGTGGAVSAAAGGSAATEAVGSAIPESLVDCRLAFCGLIGLADPPRETIKDDIAVCNKAGIRVVMITGDSGITAACIAKKIGMKDHGRIITGDMLESMDDAELRENVKTASIFSRVVPEHKMRIVQAFKDNGEVVAMTGDGVNDAPALKYADIGIAMGKRGSEVSREAADLILMDDNFSTIVDTVKDGRRIYDNIRKAVGYVFTIHIPIALSSLLAPMLGISPANLMFLPLHVVLLELVIDPTCSIVLERQPAETDIMERKPRNPKEKLLDAKTLLKSVVQGLVIFAASFGAYVFALFHGQGSVPQGYDNAAVARSMGLAVLMLGNLFLVQVNSSDRDSVIMSIGRLAKDKVMWGVCLLTLSGLAVILYTPLNMFLGLAPIPAGQLLVALGVAAASVLWYEAVKLADRARHSRFLA
ncbi:MAG: cation-translocating P-type ATPase [Coriobacteriia bacterium]|nr:cation-translocating P-type ATPase [Coriobacteriia bacterium]